MRRIYLLLINIVLLQTISLAQWEEKTTNIPGNLNAVIGWQTEVFIAGDSGVYLSVNGGDTFVKQHLLNNFMDSLTMESSTFNDIFSSYPNYWAVGKNNSTGNGVIFKYNEDSEWELSYTLVGSGLNGMGRKTGLLFVVGDDGKILYSENSGNQWNLSESGVTNNLYSIVAYTNRIHIGGEGVILSKYNFSQTSWYAHFDEGANELLALSNSYTLAVNNDNILKGSTSIWNINTNYNSSESGIRATSITQSTSTEILIGTKNGIYKSTDDLNYWELIPSSIGFDINDVHFFYTNPVGYAVGNDGLLLKTTNRGGDPIPYVSFFFELVTCVDSTLGISNNGYDGHSYSWFINDTLISNDYNIDTIFSVIGDYNIELIGDNGTFSDTINHLLSIVDLPSIENDISITDSILCHGGNSDIIVSLSDSSVEYTLLKMTSMGIDVEVVTKIGNGNDLILNTGMISDSTRYLIKVSHLKAECAQFFADTFLIAVEKTIADFYPGLINADLNEPIKFYNNSKQASFFNWSFGTQASDSTSNIEEPIISFNNLIETNVTLISTSLYGCSDTITLSGPVIYNAQAINDNCWAINFDGNQLGGHDRGEEIKTTNNGDIIVSGSYSDMEFTTKAGTTQGRHNNIGFYIARYSSNGVLKWLVRGINNNPDNDWNLTNYSYKGAAYDIAIDSEDNIIITGWLDEDFTLISNDGDSIPMKKDPFSNRNKGFILKLDSNGAYLWHTIMNNAVGNFIGLDQTDHIYVGGNYSFVAIFYSTTDDSLKISGQSQGTAFIVKYNTDGEILWLTNMQYDSNNYNNYLTDIAVDDIGSVYLTGTHGKSLTFNSVSGNSVLLTSPYGQTNAFIVKYNSEGTAEWGHSINSNEVGQSFDYGVSIEVSGQGDSYITLEVESWLEDDWIEIPSTQLPTDTLSVGKYAIISYDTDGNYRWGNGVKYSYLGRGTALTIDKYGYVYTGGYVIDNTEGGSTDFTSTDNFLINLPQNEGSFFISKYDKNGHLIWASLESGLTSDNWSGIKNVRSISVDENQNLYVTGKLYSQSQGYIVATDTLITNQTDPFIAKFSQSACLQPDLLIPLLTSQSYCPGDSIEIPFYTNEYITIDSNNTFIIELSDSLGNFAWSLIIGETASSNKVDTLQAVLPLEIGSGRFMLRIRSSMPVIIGNEIPIFITPLQIPQNVSYTICQGSSIEINATQGTQYEWSPVEGLSDSIIQTPIASPDSSIIYICNTNSFCGSIIDSIKIKVNPGYYTEDPLIEICAGDSALIYGTYKFNAGIYYDSLLTDLNCDSVFYKALVVNPGYSTEDPSIEICAGDSALIYGTYKFDAGIFYDSLLTDLNCDSVFYTELVVNPGYYTEDPSIEICAGDSALIYGTYEFIGGTYYDSLLTALNCISVYYSVLVVNPLPAVQIEGLSEDTICYNNGTVPLPAAIPSGGTYSGIGVVDNMFDPTISGLGTFEIIYTYTGDDFCTNSDTTTIVVDVCSGIINKTALKGIVFYPNPIKDKLNIERQIGFDQPVTIKIYNSNSKLITTKVILINEQKLELDVSQFSKGVYYLHFILPKENIVRKIIKI
jgi:hypothetical protein